MKIINDQEFKTIVEKSEKPIVIDFFTNWCPPCKMLSPVIEKLAEEYKDKIEFIKMDLDQCPNTGNAFAVDRIPTVIFLSNGKPKSSFVGFKDEAEIKLWLENNLSK
ncbi:MAG: thioredoxin [Candidatus Paceibacterota bacterium]